jgi:hypothetical protein
MVFYRGRAPGGTKTKWKMNEYRSLEGADAADVAAPPPSHTLQVMIPCQLVEKSPLITSQ